MIDWALSFTAPHHCCGCGIIGTILCDNCKYDIVSESFIGCFVCGGPAPLNESTCGDCNVPYDRAWCVGERSDTLKLLIDTFKFARTRSAYKQLADLLDETVPSLPADTIIVPIPTIPSHIRQRGYDHMLLIARALASKRNLRYEPYLQRASITSQRGAGRSQRASQAASAFTAAPLRNVHVPYLILDDVITTGATFEHAARTLRDAGAENIWAAAIARQPI